MKGDLIIHKGVVEQQSGGTIFRLDTNFVVADLVVDPHEVTPLADRDPLVTILSK